MKYLIANWKSNKTSAEAQTWFSEFEALLSTRRFGKDVTVVIAVPFPFVPVAAEWLKIWKSQFKTTGTQPVAVALAVQDLSSYAAGSYTGAVSVRNLEGFGVEFVILGHSERRRYFHETSADVAAKVDQAIQAEMKPIVCVDDPYIDEQAQLLDSGQKSQVIVAYEALKTIGTGNNLSAADFEKAKEEVLEAFGLVPVVYGGSVTSSNVSAYTTLAAGYLVGGASLQAADFVAILDRAFSE